MANLQIQKTKPIQYEKLSETYLLQHHVNIYNEVLSQLCGCGIFLPN